MFRLCRVLAVSAAGDSNFDWRDNAAYRALHGIDRAGLAWEWLRRDPDYAAYSHQASAGAPNGSMLVQTEANALQWGLYFPRAA